MGGDPGARRAMSSRRGTSSYVESGYSGRFPRADSCEAVSPSQRNVLRNSSIEVHEIAELIQYNGNCNAPN